MSSKDFLTIIDHLRIKKCSNIGVFVHQNADPDAITSSISLKHLLLSYIPSLSITLFASSINNLCEPLIEFLGEQFSSCFSDITLDAAFFCDFNNLGQLGDFATGPFLSHDFPIFIIDHHSFHDYIHEATVAIVRDSNSAAEVMTELYLETGQPLEADIATGLLTGILFDSRRFIYTSRSTFAIVDYLINAGGDYEKALSFLRTKISFSERVAKLKGVKRALIHLGKNEEIITIAHIGSYESSVARSLMYLGASFAIVIAKISVDNFRISLRCTKEFAKNYHLHLGELANSIAEGYSGTGGGHMTAAGLNITTDPSFPNDMEQLKQFLLNMFLEKITPNHD